MICLEPFQTGDGVAVAGLARCAAAASQLRRSVLLPRR